MIIHLAFKYFLFFGILVTTSGFVAEQDGNSSCPYKHTKTRAQLLGRANTINVLRARGLAGLSLSFHPDFPPHSPTYLPLPRTKSEKNYLKACFSEKIMYFKRWDYFKSCCSQYCKRGIFREESIFAILSFQTFAGCNFRDRRFFFYILTKFQFSRELIFAMDFYDREKPY